MAKKKDWIGKKFGRLTVIEDLGYDISDKHRRLKCECECGNVKVVLADSLTSGRTISWGCYQKIDWIGKKFGRLTVIEDLGYNSSAGSRRLKCRCECGNITVVRANSLMSGNTTSCGCYQKERTIERFTTHGMRGTRLYNIWAKMLQRGGNKNNPSYPRYGGRGIKVCPEWATFEVFRDWALANGYADNLTLERIDNNRGYYPENCRWATPKEQANNKRNNRILTINGKTQTLAEHIEDPEINIHGLVRGTVRSRIDRLEWTLEEAFSIPKGGKRNNHEVL